MRASLAAVLCLACGGSASVAAQDLQWQGYVDARLVAPDDEANWMSGGLGKLRWDDGDEALRFGGAALVLSGQLSPAWSGSASLQYQSDDDAGLSLLEAWLRWRPVSTGAWRHSLTLGLFFPPISYENGDVGWTSPYTLTPSALNSWVGEELRSTGAEYRLQHRGETTTAEFALAAFVGNDPAGEQLAARGWSLSDRVYGLGDSIREPDLAAFGAPPPRRFDPFVENDQRLGWHAELRVTTARWQFNLLRYDNRADPSSESEFEGHDIYSWRTKFWSAGARGRYGEWVVIAQGMHGNTLVVPSPFFRTDSDFWAAFALLAREQGAWRPALRVDAFGTRQYPDTLSFRSNEHGRALTFALNWHPNDHLRLTGELLALRSARSDRRLLGEPERHTAVQLQLGLRWYF